jgi:hypothetical protein
MTYKTDKTFKASAPTARNRYVSSGLRVFLRTIKVPQFSGGALPQQ